jgi:hypothetical protein
MVSGFTPAAGAASVVASGRFVLILTGVGAIGEFVFTGVGAIGEFVFTGVGAMGEFVLGSVVWA